MKPQRSRRRFQPGQVRGSGWSVVRGAPLPRVLCAFLASLLLLPAVAFSDSEFGPPILITQVMDREVAEASGLAASRRVADRFWMLNDSGNAPALYAVDRRGRTVSRTVLIGGTNVDWETLDAFLLDGTPHLMIGDVGDNQGVREQISLHFLIEPGELPAPEANVAWSVDLTLPTGPIDVESAFVDPVDGYAYLLTKRERPAWLWRVPLRPHKVGPIAAERLAAIPGIPEPTEADRRDDPRLGQYRGQATDMAMAPDRRGVVILTYGNAYWFQRGPGDSWADALQGVPVPIHLPRMIQQEGVAFAVDGSAIIVTSERWPAPLIEIRMPGP